MVLVVRIEPSEYCQNRLWGMVLGSNKVYRLFHLLFFFCNQAGKFRVIFEQVFQDVHPIVSVLLIHAVGTVMKKSIRDHQVYNVSAEHRR
jgi:hypothetical protein